MGGRFDEGDGGPRAGPPCPPARSAAFAAGRAASRGALGGATLGDASRPGRAGPFPRAPDARWEVDQGAGRAAPEQEGTMTS